MLHISKRRGEDEEKAFDEGRVISATVTAFEVAVEVDVEIDGTDPSEEEIPRAQAAIDDSFPIALSVAIDFVAWLRVHAGRYRLAPSHEPPEVLGGYLFETNSGRRVRNASFNPGLIVVSHLQDDGLTSEELDDVVALLRDGATAGAAELLLADARQTLSPPSVEHDWRITARDIRRAILLAAIASEVKIRATLLEKTPEDRRPLVELIVGNLREVQFAVATLPHKPMKAAVGRSLHEDDKNLFKAVEKLFKDRNDIAHRGEPPSLDQARLDVKAAVDLFAWLDVLPTPEDPSPEGS